MIVSFFAELFYSFLIKSNLSCAYQICDVKPSQDMSGDLAHHIMPPPFARIVYKSTYTTQHIFMKLGPNLVLKVLLS